MKTITDEKKIDELLSRGVEEVIDIKNLKEKLLKGETLRIKLGIDPTSPNIHLGRSIPLLKLRDFQELGHKVVFIIGDFTGVIGDTSDKDSERPMLAKQAVEENMAKYVDQASKIIDISKCEVHHNSEWLSKISYAELGEQADVFSLSDFISRDNIKKRLDAGKRVSLRELLYPLMQGYDSVAVKADVELGGTDQRFNLLAGRDLQKKYKQEPQNIMTNPLVEGLDGRKMSSSWGNTINLADDPNEMYGKTMSLSDNLIIRYFKLMTRVPLETIAGYEADIAGGANPKDYKMKLAFELVKFYHSTDLATKAEEYFTNTFSKKEIPDEMPEVSAGDGEVLSEVLVKNGVLSSKSEWRRLVEENAVHDLVNDTNISDVNMKVVGDLTLKIGKKKFVKVLKS